MNVYQKLNEARAKFHSLKLTKTGHNKFAGYYYFELGDFLMPALGVFREVGLCAVVSFGKEVATMLIVNTDEGDTLTIQSPMGSAALKGCHEVQNIGAVETYQRRYLWVAALEIVEHDALDATAGSEKPEKAGKAKGVVSDVLSTMPALSAEEREFLDELGVNVEDLFRQAGEVKSAFERIESENLEDHQKIYLWGRLHSTTRTALKKEGEARRIKEAA